MVLEQVQLCYFTDNSRFYQIIAKFGPDNFGLLNHSARRIENEILHELRNELLTYRHQALTGLAPVLLAI